ncbi:hypothetical protein LguiA_015580 [Lonicera macranthoides]
MGLTTGKVGGPQEGYVITGLLDAAPGVDILAARPPMSPSSIYYADTRSVNYNIISGTSMSCPHASGAATHVKAAHPNWSPAAIKSVLTTTAYVMDERKHADKEFAYGSGHINPVKAVDPGLVFDASDVDYINFLCKQGYTTANLRPVTGDDSVYNSTTVIDVGAPNSTYTATILAPVNFLVSLEPAILSFSAIGEVKSFRSKVEGPKISQQPIMSGAIVWSDGVHVVRTPP